VVDYLLLARHQPLVEVSGPLGLLVVPGIDSVLVSNFSPLYLVDVVVDVLVLLIIAVPEVAPQKENPPPATPNRTCSALTAIVFAPYLFFLVAMTIPVTATRPRPAPATTSQVGTGRSPATAT